MAVPAIALGAARLVARQLVKRFVKNALHKPKVRVEVKEVAWRGNEVKKKVERTLAGGINAAAKAAAEEAIRLASTSNYPPASLPGMPPAMRSGELAGSISYEIDVTPNHDFFAVITSDSDHAGFVEFGTRLMAPRPFMRVAARNILFDGKVQKYFRRI